MTMTLGALAALVRGTVVGDPGFPIVGACSPASGVPDRIAFAESPATLVAALASAAGAVVVDRNSKAEGKPLIRVDHPVPPSSRSSARCTPSRGRRRASTERPSSAPTRNSRRA